MPGRLTRGSTSALAQTWLENVKVKLLNLQCSVINPFFSFSLFPLESLHLLSTSHAIHKHAHAHTHTRSPLTFVFCFPAVRNRIQMSRFDCLSPRELNGVTDLYLIECEVTSNLTLSCEPHAGSDSSSAMTSCTLFHHSWPLTPMLSCVLSSEHVQILDFYPWLRFSLFLWDFSQSVRQNTDKCLFFFKIRILLKLYCQGLKTALSFCVW